MVNMKENKKEVDDKLILIAQEISFAKTLACNDKRLRERALKKLRKWILNREKRDNPTEFSKTDMLTLWKGLFYCMWMSDKPLIQEELAENISKLLHCLLNAEHAAYFLEAFFISMKENWSSIDNYRIGKFQMLIRRMLRQALKWAAIDSWSNVKKFSDVVLSTIFSADKMKPTPVGLNLHYCEIFLEELAKMIRKVGLSQDALSILLTPFIRCMIAKTTDHRLRSTIVSSVFNELIKQTDSGIEYLEKIEIWRQMGCPAIPLDDLVKEEDDDDDNNAEDEMVEEEEEVDEAEIDISDEEEEEEDEALDPRAGQVDVELSQIPFDAKSIEELFLSIAAEATTNNKARRSLKKVAQKFKSLAEGQYPLDLKIPIHEEDQDILEWDLEEAAEKAAENLQKFEHREKIKEIKMGVANPKLKKRLSLTQVIDEEEDTPDVDTPKTKRRRSDSWLVTDVANNQEETINCGATQNSWIVSPNNKPSEWNEPLQDGEYEYFVAARKKKSPKRKSLNKPSVNGVKNDEVKCNENGDKDPQTPTLESIFKEISEKIPSSLKKKSPQISPEKNNAPHRKSESPKKTENSPQSDNGTNGNITPKGRRVSFITLSTRTKDMAVINGTPTTPKTPASRISMTDTESLQLSLSSSKKKVEFHLNRNKFQEVREYAEQLRNSPGIPHDPSKKPERGLLKVFTPSPIRPSALRNKYNIFS